RGCRASAAARLPAQRETLLRKFALVSFETALEQGHQIATRQPVPRKPAHALEQLAKLAIGRKMHAIAIRRERFESPWFRQRWRGQRFARSRFGHVCPLQLERRLRGRDLCWHLLRRAPNVETGGRLRRQATHQLTNIGSRKARREQLLD